MTGLPSIHQADGAAAADLSARRPAQPERLSQAQAPTPRAAAEPCGGLGGASVAIPLLGVTASFSPQSLQLIAGMAADAVGGVPEALDELGQAGASLIKGATEAVGAVGTQAAALISAASGGVAAGADALAEGLAATRSQVAEAAGAVVGYGALAALAAGAVLNELA